MPPTINLKALQNPPPPTPATTKLEHRLKQLDKPTHKAIHTLLTDPTRPHSQTAEILTQAGFPISSTGVSAWRKRNNHAS